MNSNVIIAGNPAKVVKENELLGYTLRHTILL